VLPWLMPWRKFKIRLLGWMISALVINRRNGVRLEIGTYSKVCHEFTLARREMNPHGPDSVILNEKKDLLFLCLEGDKKIKQILHFVQDDRSVGWVVGLT
jgi:hypothetical protein